MSNDDNYGSEIKNSFIESTLPSWHDGNSDERHEYRIDEIDSLTFPFTSKEAIVIAHHNQITHSEEVQNPFRLKEFIQKHFQLEVGYYNFILTSGSVLNIKLTPSDKIDESKCVYEYEKTVTAGNITQFKVILKDAMDNLTFVGALKLSMKCEGERPIEFNFIQTIDGYFSYSPILKKAGKYHCSIQNEKLNELKTFELDVVPYVNEQYIINNASTLIINDINEGYQADGYIILPCNKESKLQLKCSDKYHNELINYPEFKCNLSSTRNNKISCSITNNIITLNSSIDACVELTLQLNNKSVNGYPKKIMFVMQAQDSLQIHYNETVHLGELLIIECKTITKPTPECIKSIKINNVIQNYLLYQQNDGNFVIKVWCLQVGYGEIELDGNNEIYKFTVIE